MLMLLILLIKLTMLTMAISLSSILLQVRAAETHQEKAARLAQDNARHAEAREREKKKKKTLDDLWRARLAKCDKYIAKQREVRF